MTMASSDPEERSKLGSASRRVDVFRAMPEVIQRVVAPGTIVEFFRLQRGGGRSPAERGAAERGAADRTLMWVAQQQHGIITARQLYVCGLSADAITTRVNRGQLRRVHRGVYALALPHLLPGARELAAALACGPDAVVSHRSAIAVWKFLPAFVDAPVDVTIPAVCRRSRPGIRVHRVAQLPSSELRVRDGIPVTSPARTLFDFASQALGDDLERAIAEAYVLGLCSERELDQVIARHPTRPGAGVLKAEVKREGGPAWTRLEAERRMKELIRSARLPAPQCNHFVAGFPADFLWVRERLVVEIDGYRAHGHRRAFERDRRRDAAHVLAGYRVIRITWIQLRDEPVAAAVTIARALELARAGNASGRGHG